ncbi:ABC-type multidrug transport system, permease component [Micrococcus lylae]|uniref:ABC-type multidrug transport system, permease component n=1 Tax=Micrococcus lylae TaxID=1273 RepID=A0A1R4I8R5_9MICC|nr:ABC transporter permease [Micrococcus lylae]SJN16281.1 ABC-type multidrug transport system, permease component [Micrococcus lylae]
MSAPARDRLRHDDGPVAFSSTAAPASLPARILAQARLEARTALRNGEQLLVTLVLPLLALLGVHVTGLLDTPGRSGVDVAAPGVLALAVMSSAFTSTAIATGFERRYDVLAALATTPLGTAGLVLGKALAVLAQLAVQVVVIGGVALALGWSPALSGILPGLVTVGTGAVAFTALALLLAGTARPEATLAAANLLWVLFGALGGTVFPPRWDWIGLLPSGALGEGLRTAFIDGTWDLGALAVLLVWSAAGVLLCLRLFRWRP